jgi:hypothetical protein
MPATIKTWVNVLEQIKTAPGEVRAIHAGAVLPA